MNSNFLNQLGNWNPQLLREWKGRLRPRSAIAAISVSVIGQILFVLAFWQGMQFSQDVPGFWRGQFLTLSWVLPYGLFLAGVYTLISDLTTEEQRGTLNFIRLSPRPSTTILLGKILGVPALAYLALFLVVPLHVITALASGASLAFLVSFYVLILAACALLYSASLLVAFLGGKGRAIFGQQSVTAISFAALTLFSFAPLFMLWCNQIVWVQLNRPVGPETTSFADFMEWFYLPIGKNVLLAHLFTLANLLLPTLGIWRVLQRRFHNPTATILSKRQSYAFIAYLQVLVLGFSLRSDVNTYGEYAFWPVLAITYFINFMAFLILIAALSPQRVALLDWVRFERRGHLIQDLIWGEKSPAPVAIGVNLVIANALLIPWIMLWPADRLNASAKPTALLILGIFACVMLIYAVIAQTILATNTNKPATWATGALATLIFLPPIVLGILRIEPQKFPIIWAFFGFPWPETVATNPFQTVSLALALLGQVIVLGLLGYLLVQQLQKLAIRDARET
ncbi:MAG: hypothetical protein SFW36_11030 [Leptolyngbyaceae cyanobacterium bins.59]|nr:hypothetical protein [Leptolyngbyaceae cyanobacterium bins.59]